MNYGKNICRQLKAIRKQIADANEIDYTPTECHHKGECKGTCPRCESEMRYIEEELNKRSILGKSIAIVGLAAGLSTSAQAYSTQSIDGDDASTGNTTSETTGDEYIELEGDISLIDEIEINFENETEAPIEDEQEEVYLVVEDMPEFPGGNTALHKYIAENTHFPIIEGELIPTKFRVYVNFIINENGNVTNAKIVRSHDEYSDKEALRVVNSMPKWKPGSRRGKTVKVSYTIPVNFVIH